MKIVTTILMRKFKKQIQTDEVGFVLYNFLWKYLEAHTYHRPVHVKEQ